MSKRLGGIIGCKDKTSFFVESAEQLVFAHFLTVAVLVLRRSNPRVARLFLLPIDEARDEPSS